MQNRLIVVRKRTGLTQSDFGARIGVSRGAIAKYETGLNIPPDVTIKAIAREFGISYDWLKTGEGEMIVETDDITELIARCLMNENETAQAVFKAFAQLDEADWQVIAKLIESLKG